MKQILFHFRISLFLGVMILLCFSCQLSANVLMQKHLRHDVESENSSSSGENPVLPKNPDDSNPENSDPTKNPSDRFAFATDLIIKAINPGYTIDKTQNVGEFIELQKLTDNPDFSLAGYGLRYTNSSGNNTILLDFSEGSSLTGETLLMRFARSPDSDRADATYMTTLAMTTGRVDLIYRNEAIDSVCWGSGKDCLASFKSTQPTSLVRNLTTGTFQHTIDYEPTFDPLHPSLVLPPEPAAPPGSTDNSASGNAPEITARCYELEFSEILTYYANDKSEQFVELYNPSDKTIALDQCALRYKKKTYHLSGEIAPDGYYAYYPTRASAGFSLTKDPNSSNTLELIDANSTVIDTLVYNHGQKKSTSYARFYSGNGEEIWDSTYAPTPGSANTYQEYRSCPAGKIINPDTGNCINTTSSSGTTVCPEGKYLNPLTGRCKNVTSTSDTSKPCAAGYERSPTTNRCRKIKSDNNGANYALVPNTSSSKSVFIAAGVIAGIVSLGVIYVILQFRREIARTFRKFIQRFNHIREHLIARCRRFYRKK